MHHNYSLLNDDWGRERRKLYRLLERHDLPRSTCIDRRRGRSITGARVSSIIEKSTAVLTSLSSSVYTTNALQFVHDDQHRVELIEEFERVGLSRQIELGKRIIALRKQYANAVAAHVSGLT